MAKTSRNSILGAVLQINIYTLWLKVTRKFAQNVNHNAQRKMERWEENKDTIVVDVIIYGRVKVEVKARYI